jgi:hypothetical protein
MLKKLFSLILSVVIGLSLFLTSCVVNNIADVDSMSPSHWSTGLAVNLKPTNAKADTVYTVELYEKGELRGTTTVTWDQPQINVKSIQVVGFNLTQDEYNTYTEASWSNSKWWKSIFSVKVRNPNQTTYATKVVTTTTKAVTTKSVPINPSQQVSLKMTYPNGGEIWHIGDTVDITWTTKNWSHDVTIGISYDSGQTWNCLIVMDTPDVGKYTWVVKPLQWGSNGVMHMETVSTNCRIRIGLVTNSEVDYTPAISANDFTILPK